MILPGPEHIYIHIYIYTLGCVLFYFFFNLFAHWITIRYFQHEKIPPRCLILSGNMACKHVNFPVLLKWGFWIFSSKIGKTVRKINKKNLAILFLS